MSETAPLVSIGIPTYNRERLIGRAIESALHQDYLNIEIVISDNASTDSTPEVCRRYAQTQPNVRYVRQPRNLGATRNFDAVLEQTSGQFFMWLGDDDWLDSNYVRLALSRLETDPQVALVSGTPHYYAKGVHSGSRPGLQSAPGQRVAARAGLLLESRRQRALLRADAATELQDSTLPNFMGGDWVFVANTRRQRQGRDAGRDVGAPRARWRDRVVRRHCTGAWRVSAAGAVPPHRHRRACLLRHRVPQCHLQDAPHGGAAMPGRVAHSAASCSRLRSTRRGAGRCVRATACDVRWPWHRRRDEARALHEHRRL